MINYELAKEIGATHHIDELLYKFNDSGVAMCYFSEYGWDTTENKSIHMSELERIDFKKCAQPKRTRTEYEKVTESASHVIDEFENGGNFYYMAPSLTKPALANRDGVFNKLRDGDALYRKVEKEIDWRDEVSNFVDDKYSYITIHENGAVGALLAVSSNIDFLEMCRVALRANGEIE